MAATTATRAIQALAPALRRVVVGTGRRRRRRDGPAAPVGAGERGERRARRLLGAGEGRVAVGTGTRCAERGFRLRAEGRAGLGGGGVARGRVGRGVDRPGGGGRRLDRGQRRDRGRGRHGDGGRGVVAGRHRRGAGGGRRVGGRGLARRIGIGVVGDGRGGAGFCIPGRGHGESFSGRAVCRGLSIWERRYGSAGKERLRASWPRRPQPNGRACACGGTEAGLKSC